MKIAVDLTRTVFLCLFVAACTRREVPPAPATADVAPAAAVPVSAPAAEIPVSPVAAASVPEQMDGGAAPPGPVAKNDPDAHPKRPEGPTGCGPTAMCISEVDAGRRAQDDDAAQTRRDILATKVATKQLVTDKPEVSSLRERENFEISGKLKQTPATKH